MAQFSDVDVKRTTRRQVRSGVEDRWKRKDGTPTARAGTGKRWLARYVDHDGREVSKSFKTQAEAKSWLAPKSATLTVGGYVAPDKESVTLGQVEAQWRSGLVARTSTVATYTTLVDQHILPVWRDTAIRSIKRREVQAWLRELRKRPKRGQDIGDPVSAATARQTFKLLRQIFATAMDPTDPIVSVDPTRGVKGPSLDTADHKFASPAQVERIARAIDYRAAQPKQPGRRTDLLAASAAEASGLADTDDDGQTVIPDAPVSADGLLVRMLGATGARFGEIAALRVGRLSLDATPPTLFIREGAVEVGGQVIVSEPKTRESVRRVPFRKSLVSLLRAHLLAQGIGEDPEAFVFSDRDGGPLRLRNWSARVFRPAAALAGVDITVHGLRHSAASAAIREGMTPVQVSRILGHSKPSITLDIYSHEFPDDLTAIGADD